MTVLVPFLFSTGAYIIIRMRNKFIEADKTGWVQAIVLASLAFLFSLLAVAGSGQEAVYWGFILLMAGVPFYVLILWKKKE